MKKDYYNPNSPSYNPFGKLNIRDVVSLVNAAIQSANVKGHYEDIHFEIANKAYNKGFETGRKYEARKNASKKKTA